MRSAPAARSSSAISRLAGSVSTTCCWSRPSTSRPRRSSTCCSPSRSTAASRSTRCWCSAGSRRARRSAASRSASAPSWSACCAASVPGGLAKVFVITGPSGVGKGTLIRTLLERVGELELSVSATTRRPRPGETHEVDYHFLSDDEFERRVQAGPFVEHARYSGRRYGTLRTELEARIAGGHPVVLEIEVQGARQIREAMPEAVQIFIAPPSEEALRARLVGRGTDDPDQVAARLATAREELGAQGEFGHVVVNDRLEDASDALVEGVRVHLARPCARES